MSFQDLPDLPAVRRSADTAVWFPCCARYMLSAGVDLYAIPVTTIALCMCLQVQWQPWQGRYLSAYSEQRCRGRPGAPVAIFAAWLDFLFHPA